MKSRNVLMLILGLNMIVCVVQNSQADSIGTAFTYQGRFMDSNSPADGMYDFEYKMYDALTLGTQLGNAIYKDNLEVIDGYFTTELDFGTGVFDGEARWLEISVRPGDSTGSYTTLNPRQELTPVPYAMYVKGCGWIDEGTVVRLDTVTDNVGIGLSNPTADLHVSGSGDNVFKITETYYGNELRIGTDAQLTNYLRIRTSQGDGLAITGNQDFIGVFVKASNSYVGIRTSDPKGTLDVNGSIYQRGSLLHADYVFEPDYELESVEEHSQFMRQNGHLRAIPKAEINADGQEVVELGAHRRGMVEELEKAHIYIEQLNKRVKELEEKLATLEAKEGGA